MKLFSILTAAACLLVVSACASTPAPTDERVHVMEANANVSVQPGNVYVSADAAKIFTFRDVETEINENGYLAVRVFGKTCELSALKWAFFGDINYEFAYRFFWFDADGNPVEGPEDFRLRSTIPGDPVRFVGHAPTEECRNYALELRLASEEAAASDSAEAADTAAAEDEGEAESDAAQMEEERVKEIIPDLPEQNVTGDKQDVKVIGISDKDAESVPKAVPADKE
jgi:uncharacterized protein YcfL